MYLDCKKRTCKDVVLWRGGEGMSVRHGKGWKEEWCGVDEKSR